MAITLNGSTGITTDIDGDESLTLNRDTSDGDIITLQKDGTNVGSIGVINNNNPFIANDADNSGLQFGTNQIIPHYDSYQRDDAVDLGSSSVRFKDLYLSGGVYVGGTGSANYLDDYEEGEYTVSMTTSGGDTYTLNSNYNKAGYVKIGNLVTVSGRLIPSSLPSSPSGRLLFSLPFTSTSSLSGQAEYSAATIFPSDVNSGYSVDAFVGWVGSGSNKIDVYYGDTTQLFSGSSTHTAAVTVTGEWSFSVTYRTA